MSVDLRMVLEAAEDEVEVEEDGGEGEVMRTTLGMRCDPASLRRDDGVEGKDHLEYHHRRRGLELFPRPSSYQRVPMESR